MDILLDLEERLFKDNKELAALDAEQQAALRSIWEKARNGIRRDWGGERPYIPVRGESADIEMTRRNIAIRRDHRAGESVSLIARRYGISRMRVYQVLEM